MCIFDALERKLPPLRIRISMAPPSGEPIKLEKLVYWNAPKKSFTHSMALPAMSQRTALRSLVQTGCSESLELEEFWDFWGLKAMFWAAKVHSATVGSLYPFWEGWKALAARTAS